MKYTIYCKVAYLRNGYYTIEILNAWMLGSEISIQHLVAILTQMTHQGLLKTKIIHGLRAYAI